MPNTVNYALCSIPDLVELVQLQERMIAEQHALIALLKEALTIQEGTQCPTSIK